MKYRRLEREVTAFVADIIAYLDKFVRKFADKDHARQLFLTDLWFRKNLLEMRAKCRDFQVHAMISQFVARHMR